MRFNNYGSIKNTSSQILDIISLLNGNHGVRMSASTGSINIMGATGKYGFTNGYTAGAAADTTLERIAEGIVGCNGTIQQKDLISGFALNNDLTQLTADRTITYPNFDFNFSNYFDSNGNIIAKGDGSNSAFIQIGNIGMKLIRDWGNLLFFTGYTPLRISNYAMEVTSDVHLTWSDHQYTAGSGTKDVGIKRLTINKLGITQGTDGTRGELDFKFQEYTTAERTALPNTANTTVYDTDTNKLYTNDGTVWNALW